jgi:protein-tyrosine phosphatase
MKSVWWVEEGQNPRVAIVARPRGGEWLEDDLTAMKNAGIDVVVSLLREDEAEELGLADEATTAERLGMRFISYPIPDRCTPQDGSGFRRLVSELAELVKEGHRVGAHCRACIGRSTVLTSSVLIALGVDPEDALLRIEAARECFVPDTPEQREWILQFRAAP